MADWKALVKNIAPVLGTALGGPAGGAAVAALSSLLLGNDKGSAKDVEAAVLSASPETLLKIRELDNDFDLKMKQLGIDVFKIEVDDRKNARELFKVDKRPQIMLSALFVGGYFLIMVPMMLGKVSVPETPTLAGLILVLTVNMATIMNFWFGSSSGSKDKTAAGS